MGDIVNLHDDEQEEVEYIVICEHKEHKHFTTFGTFLDREHAEHFMENYGFAEGEFNLKAAPLNIVWSREDSGYDS